MLRKSLIVAATSLSLVLASCGSDSEQSGNTGTSQGDDTVTVWIPGDEQEYGYYYDMFENYKEHIEQQGGTFNYVIEQQPWSDYWTKLPLEVNNGRGPDMFLAHDSYMDVLLPISKELDLDSEITDNLTIKGLYTGENGKDKFVPTVLVTSVMYANTDIVGDMTEFPQTWEELDALAKQYTDNANGVIGFDYSFNILEDLQYDNKETYTENGEIVLRSSPYEKLTKWQDEGITDYYRYGNGSPEDTFNENAVAFIHGATWMEFWAPDDAKVRMKAFPVPHDNADGYQKMAGEPTFGINKNVSDEKYAVLNDLVKFMLTDEETITAIVKGNSGIANNKNIEVSYEPYTAGDAVLKTLEAREGTFVILPTSLEDIMKSNLEAVLMGTDIDSVLQDASLRTGSVNTERLSAMEEALK